MTYTTSRKNSQSWDSAAGDILTMVGVGSEGRGDKVLDLVTASFHTSHDPRKWFGEFVSIFSHEAAYVNLATSIYDCMSTIIDTAKTMVLTQHIFVTHHPVLHYSHTRIPLTDLLCHHRYIGRSQVMSHNEHRSVLHASSHTNATVHSVCEDCSQAL